MGRSDEKFFEDYFRDHDFMCEGSRNNDSVNVCIWAWVTYGAVDDDKEFKRRVLELIDGKVAAGVIHMDPDRSDMSYLDDKINTVFTYLPNWGGTGTEESAMNYVIA